MIARALVAGGFTEFAPRMAADGPDLDSLLPILVKNLVMPGFIGLLIVGILSSVMSTISAFLGSISTLFTFDVYRKWIRPQASEKELVRVGIAATAILMAFGICYSPLIGYFGGIFKYFQTMTAYIAAPVATVYLFGIFWRRTTPAAALSIMLGGIPLGIAIHWILPHVFSAETMAGFSLGNPFVEAGICQIVCAILMVVISLMTTPRPVAEIEPLVWKWKLLWLPEDEPKRRFFCSVPFWWSVFIVFYICVVAYLW
jgi:SSS family solute:Na+ symporter